MMIEPVNMRPVWEKILEYATSPVQGTLSRKQRKGVKIQINDGEVLENATVFMSNEFIRFTQKSGNENVNSYYAWEGVQQIKTISPQED
ncbi:MAG TPA: hypothetical protein PK624_11475 [Spirochaetota bacterium]|jgi:hypothetical protein|nr:hypothetical protein [Spirochaetota bacterium]HOH38234.1 hypothetical protein [Spirochaetota bacterium]HOR45400.1 hypothetical protein [Spirochaetota bacterium]HPJ14374.1 hypothetical protein [Spirochaetota bacterium]HPK57109.1 hypothetical protein [Spirochaetota bacterium]